MYPLLKLVSERESPMNEITVYTAREAAEVARCSRARVDGACSTGALAAHDLTPTSSRRSWRILAEDLREWIRAGYPLGASLS